MHYASMIAKLICPGDDSNQAIARPREALNVFLNRGLTPNIPFQAAVVQHPRFVSGIFTTAFLAEDCLLYTSRRRNTAASSSTAPNSSTPTPNVPYPRLPSSRAKPMAAPMTCCPVSYTHLDVYKRQSSKNSWCETPTFTRRNRR